MPAALLALLLLAATVDPSLVESLRLLAEVGARDAGTRGARGRDRGREAGDWRRLRRTILPRPLGKAR